MKCPYCDFKCDNSEIYTIHVGSCLENQKLNGLIKDETPAEQPADQTPVDEQPPADNKSKK